MKYIKIFFAACMAVLFTACSEDLPLTGSDESTYMSFSLGAPNYVKYTPATARQIALYGYANFGTSGEKTIFNQIQLGFNTTTEKWEYANPVKWGLYTSDRDFSFVGVMPYSAEVDVANTATTITLSAPFDLGDGNYNTTDEEAALMSAVPATPAFREQVSMKMDRALCGFKIAFKLGEDMSKIRTFRIKSVEMYGSHDDAGNLPLPRKGVMSRTYTLAAGEWTANNISWAIGGTEGTDVITKTKLNPLAIAKRSSAPAQFDLQSGMTEALDWSDYFYIIPCDFEPVIAVTYDVFTKDGSGVDVLTREDVTSTITFAKNANFPSYTTNLMAGTQNTITINIVPSYLYVLADVDQKQGYLVIEE